MASLSEPSASEKQEPQGPEVRSLRKVTSLGTLRGRAPLPRASGDGSASVASKFSRSASLGRYRTRHSPTKEKRLVSRRTQARRNLACGYAQPDVAQQGVENNETRTWAMGRVSMMFLLFVTFTDVAVKIVNNQMSQIEAHDYYDALSPDVIRPAFLYKTDTINIEKPSLGLGSAAISSITDALGPILPFTGGVDLRRSEYYTLAGNALENIYGLVQQTVEAYANAKEDALEPQVVTKKSAKRKPSSAKKGKKKHALTLGASDPFVSLDSIAELTLGDVGTIFDYATRRSVEGFNPAKFHNGALPRVKSVLQAIENAVAKSRGQGAEVARVDAKDTSVGNTDAFLFCAVMRVFAEWRVLRQVPEGYKGYAVGMSLGQKDVLQNVAKMERAAQAWIDDQLELELGANSPTLRDVLQYEIDIGEHASLPRLKEVSGAMGLLWVRRQLHYQTVIFQNILEVPSKYPSSKDAVAAAYTEVYGQYHGWAVQKVFSYSFQASPKVEEIYNFMNPHRLAEVKEIARNMESKHPVEGGDEDVQPDLKSKEQPPENPLQRIGWEWEKLIDAIGQNLSKLGAKDRKERDGGQSGSGLSGAELEEFICTEMSKNVHEHVVSYLNVVKPVLEDLAGLFDELNMDDPTKV